MIGLTRSELTHALSIGVEGSRRELSVRYWHRVEELADEGVLHPLERALAETTAKYQRPAKRRRRSTP